MIFEFQSGEQLSVERLKMLSAIFDRITTGVGVLVSGVTVRFIIDNPEPRCQGATVSVTNTTSSRERPQ